MQTKGAVMDKQQMRDRKGRWRCADPTQKCLRASSRPRLGVSSSFHLTHKWHWEKMGENLYWSITVLTALSVWWLWGTQLSTTQAAVNLELQGKVKIAHPPPGFPTCCTDCPGNPSLGMESCQPAAPLGALAQVTFSFWLQIPPAGRGTGCFPQGRSGMNEKEGWNAPQITSESWGGNLYSWVQCPEDNRGEQAPWGSSHHPKAGQVPCP